MSNGKRIKVKHAKESFRERITDLFEEMWEKIGEYRHGASERDVPTDTDLSEAGDTLTYALELPGMDENDVEVAIESGRLTVRGEKRDEREETGVNYVFRERRFGRFERVFTLPANAQEDKVSADFKKGVLTVTVPCRADGKRGSRRIEVTAG